MIIQVMYNYLTLGLSKKKLYRPLKILVLNLTASNFFSLHHKIFIPKITLIFLLLYWF